MKIEINYRRKMGKFINMWKLTNTPLNNQWIKEEFKREIKKYLETNENGNTAPQNVWDAEKAVPRGKHNDKCLHLEKKKNRSQINNLILYSFNLTLY